MNNYIKEFKIQTGTKELEESIELSDVVEKRKVEVAEMILARRAEMGVEVTRK